MFAFDVDHSVAVCYLFSDERFVITGCLELGPFIDSDLDSLSIVLAVLTYALPSVIAQRLVLYVRRLLEFED